MPLSTYNPTTKQFTQTPTGAPPQGGLTDTDLNTAFGDVNVTIGTVAAGVAGQAGAAAQSAVQALPAVARSGNYNDLVGKPDPSTGTGIAGNDPRIPTGNAGAALGAAVLGNDGKVPAAQLPAQAGSTAPAPTSRVVTATGPVTILASDAGGSVFINKAGSEATTVTLLPGVRVTVHDGKGDAPTNGITFVSTSGGKIAGQASIILNGSYDSLTFDPVPNSNNFGIR